MTSEIKMNQSSENTTDVNNESDKRDKQKKIQDKLKDLGVMRSDKQKPDTAPRRFPVILVVFLLALPVAAVTVYAFMPEEVNKLLSFNDVTNADVTADNVNAAKPVRDSRLVFQKETGNTADAQNRNGFTSQLQPRDTYQASSRSEHNKWMAERQADFEKRRAEFHKRNASNRTDSDYRYQRHQQAFNQMPWSATPPQQPPQWVKDQQAEMQKQRAQYIQELNEQQARMNKQNQWAGANDVHNSSRAHEYKRPEYFNHPRMNNYQSQQDTNSPVTQAQQPAVVYQQNPPQYYNPYGYRGWGQANFYNTPAYQYGPYGLPYGWQGPGYR